MSRILLVLTIFLLTLGGYSQNGNALQLSDIADISAGYLPESTDDLVFSVKPNPVQLGEDLTISFSVFSDKTVMKVKIMDVIGNRIFFREYRPAKSIDLTVSSPKFRTGVFILEIEQGNAIARKRINIID
jgi:hypothetical protein